MIELERFTNNKICLLDLVSKKNLLRYFSNILCLKVLHIQVKNNFVPMAIA